MDGPYRKIPNISPGLLDIFKHILGAYIRGACIRTAFGVSICVFKNLKSVKISINYRYCGQKISFFKLRLTLSCFETYLKASQYLCLYHDCWHIYLFLKNFEAEPEIQHLPYYKGGLYLGGLIFGRNFVLVGKLFVGLIFGGAYIRDFTVC